MKLRVIYVPPPKPPSPVREGSEEGSSPRASLSEGSNLNYQEVRHVTIISCFIVLNWFVCDQLSLLKCRRRGNPMKHHRSL